MNISKRKQEFLQSIQRLFQQRGEPVHYQEIARDLGVSKWTAYDAVQDLRKKGLVRVEYLLNESGQVGRSRLGVVPVKQDSGEEGHSMPISLSEIRRVIEEISLSDLLEKIDNSRSRELFCGYAILLLIRFLGRYKVRFEVTSLLQLPVNAPRSGIAVALGVILGTIASVEKDRELVDQARDLVLRVQHYLEEFSEEKQARLQRLWDKAVEAVGI